MASKLPTLELLNFEGPVLTANKYRNLYIITDEWKEIVAVLLGREFEDFVDGSFTITDSKDRKWCMAEQNRDAKPSPQSVQKFIKD